MTLVSARDRRVVLVQLARRFGQASAIDAGFRVARGDIIVTMDADGQNDPTDIPLLLGKLAEGYDVAFGWRKDRKDTLIRTLPSKCANWLIKKVIPFPGHDLGCTLRAIKRRFADDLQLFGEMHRFIPILLSWRGARCAEVVVQHHARTIGKSKYGLGRTVRVVLDLIVVKFVLQYSTTPMRFFGSIGLLSIATGVAGGVAAAILKITYGFDPTVYLLCLLTIGSVLTGIQFVALGLLGELYVHTFLGNRGKRPYLCRKIDKIYGANTLMDRSGNDLADTESASVVTHK
jgi:glycosyltransferase involved in cell wall biosynthesis